MELEMFIIGFLFGTAAVSITVSFFHVNKDAIITPMDFFRIKVYQAKACLTCDLIYHDSEQSCPLCFEKESIPLRKYFSPLIPLSITKKEEKNGKVSYSLSMVGKEKCPDNLNTEFVFDDNTESTDIKHDAAQTNQPSRFAPDYKPEPPTARTGEGYNYSRVGMESKGSFLKGCCRAHAGYAKLLTFIKDGFILSGKEHTRRV